MSELYLVRHAQASFGAANYDQLSDLGHKQSRWLGDYMGMRGLKFDTLVVGDMVRHHETMNGICAGMDIDGSSRLVLPGLNEYNFIAMIDSYKVTMVMTLCSKRLPIIPKTTDTIFGCCERC